MFTVHVTRKTKEKTIKLSLKWPLQDFNVVVVEKENNKAIIVDIASPWDHRVYEKEFEGEKIEKTMGGLGIWK